MTTASPPTDRDPLADSIAGLMRRDGLWPLQDRIALLVTEHRDAFMVRIALEHGVTLNRSFVGYLRTIKSAETVETLIRHRALLDKLRQEALDEVTV